MEVTGYVRCRGLSANQLVHVPGAGDFQIERIEVRAQPAAGVGPRSLLRAPGAKGSGMDVEAGSYVVLPVQGVSQQIPIKIPMLHIAR